MVAEKLGLWLPHTILAIDLGRHQKVFNESTFLRRKKEESLFFAMAPSAVVVSLQRALHGTDNPTGRPLRTSGKPFHSMHPPPNCCAVVDSLSRCTRHPRQSPDRRPERPAARTDGYDRQPATGRQSDVLDVSTTFSGKKHRPDCLVAPPLPICQLHPPHRHVSTLRFRRFRFGSSTAAIDRRQ